MAVAGIFSSRLRDSPFIGALQPNINRNRWRNEIIPPLGGPVSPTQIRRKSGGSSLARVRASIDRIAGLAVFLELVAHRAYADAERGGSLRAVALGLTQGRADRLFFQLIQPEHLARSIRQ